jgi:hypothetical protein
MQKFLGVLVSKEKTENMVSQEKAVKMAIHLLEFIITY